MGDTNGLKITYAKNLNTLNFNSTLSIPIDANVNIKTLLDISSYIYDEKVECGSGKGILSAKLGIKVVYVDTDNITNTVFDSTNINETFVDQSITSDSLIVLGNASIVNNVLSTDGTLKINCDVSLSPTMYINLSISNNSSQFENMVVKKNEIMTSTISNTINSNFDHTLNLETKDNISKILCNNSYFTLTNATAFDNFITIEGKIYSTLVYETVINGENYVKQINDISNVKTDVNVEGLTKDSSIDICCFIDKSKENISTDLEDDNSIITIANTINVQGVAMREILLDIVDDMYSVDNEVELSVASREITKCVNNENVTDAISSEITLQENESAIDEVIANLDISATNTNYYIKDGTLFVEGVVSSQLVYVDENKNYQQKQTEIPYIINTKLNLETISCVHINVSVTDCKVKVKRGTIIELEYSLCFNICAYESENIEMIDNISIGKSLDFSNYDYQIFLAQPNETTWDLCKRIKISPDDLNKMNKDLPSIFDGGEKVIIKR